MPFGTLGAVFLSAPDRCADDLEHGRGTVTRVAFTYAVEVAADGRVVVSEPDATPPP